MIAANELRIGNWVNINGVNLFLTPELFCLVVTKQIVSHKPIPLTPEVLRDCGFEKIGVTREENDLYQIICGERKFTLEKVASFFYESVRVDSLHHLQNIIFALTQTELTYKPS